MSALFSDTLAQVLTCWRIQGVVCNPGASPEAVRALEQLFGQPFEPAFTAYLYQANGFAGGDWDQDLFSFWSTERIVEEVASQPPALLCFADYCINLGSFGFLRDGNDPKIYLHYQTAAYFEAVADSFHDFLIRYLQDPKHF